MERSAPLLLCTRFGLIVSSVLALLVATPGAVRADARAEPLRLILSGTDVMLPADLVVDGIIRKVLASSTTGLLEFYSEGLDAYRSKSSEYEPELVSSSPVTRLVADVHLPGASGLELQRRLVESGHERPVVFITAHDTTAARKGAGELDAIVCLTKPFEGHAQAELRLVQEKGEI